jgi:hypothetical protein
VPIASSPLPPSAGRGRAHSRSPLARRRPAAPPRARSPGPMAASTSGTASTSQRQVLASTSKARGAPATTSKAQGAARSVGRLPGREESVAVPLPAGVRTLTAGAYRNLLGELAECASTLARSARTEAEARIASAPVSAKDGAPHQAVDALLASESANRALAVRLREASRAIMAKPDPRLAADLAAGVSARRALQMARGRARARVHRLALAPARARARIRTLRAAAEAGADRPKAQGAPLARTRRFRHEGDAPPQAVQERRLELSARELAARRAELRQKTLEARAKRRVERRSFVLRSRHQRGHCRFGVQCHFLHDMGQHGLATAPRDVPKRPRPPDTPPPGW